MELRRLTTERRHPDRVLQQPARIAVMAIPARRRQRPQRIAQPGIGEEGADEARETRMRDLAGEKLEEAVELVCISPQCRNERTGISVGRGLKRAHLQLQPTAEPLHPAEHPHCVTLTETLVEQLDVVPHTRLDPPARIHQLE